MNESSLDKLLKGNVVSLTGLLCVFFLLNITVPVLEYTSNRLCLQQLISHSVLSTIRGFLSHCPRGFAFVEAGRLH